MKSEEVWLPHYGSGPTWVYHRTVIVTAAVHRSLSTWLPNCLSYLALLTYRHWAGVSPYTLHFCFAETCVLVKQLLSVIS